MKIDKNYILQNFPFLEDDFDALTDYVLFSKLYGKQIDYDLLEKKPKINGIELKGDLSLNTLGIQKLISSTDKLPSDLVTDTNQVNKFVTASDKVTWNGKQDAITNDSKLSADLVNDSDTTNKFVTSTDITNWNNKLSMTSGTWLPNIRGETTNGTATYSIQEGQYCIIGKILFYNFRIGCTLTGSSGLLTIGGLPSFTGYEASVGSIESNIRSATTDTRLYGQRLLLGDTLIGAVSDLNWSNTEYIYGTGFIMLQ